MTQRKIYATLFISSILSFCCNSPRLSSKDIIGTLVGKGDVVIILKEDSTFVASNFPLDKFFPKDSARSTFGGKGLWAIENNGTYWKVKLDFRTTSVPDELCVGDILIGGKNGVMENRPPWYLFFWVGEEGGERFEFSKR